LPADPEPATRHPYHLFTLFIDPDRAGIDRDAFLQAMTRQNVGVGVHYLSIPEHPIYRKLYSWRPEDYPHARRIGWQTVSLPLSPALSDDDVTEVIEAVTQAVSL
jgi:dTDP-4-amino-4,6-dideoxygalactose transaminase